MRLLGTGVVVPPTPWTVVLPDLRSLHARAGGAPCSRSETSKRVVGAERTPASSGPAPAGEVGVASAQSIVEGEVRELVRRRQLDPVLEPEATRRLVDEVLLDYLDRAAMSALPPR